MTTFVAAAPVLASLDIERTVEFYRSRLGFRAVHVDPGRWGIVARDDVQIHFWPCEDKRLLETTSCRVYVDGIDELFAHCEAQGVVHPNAPLAAKPWGTREFGALDRDGNLIVFVQRVSSPP